jgi:hypothetical protein
VSTKLEATKSVTMPNRDHVGGTPHSSEQRHSPIPDEWYLNLNSSRQPVPPRLGPSLCNVEVASAFDGADPSAQQGARCRTRCIDDVDVCAGDYASGSGKRRSPEAEDDAHSLAAALDSLSRSARRSNMLFASVPVYQQYAPRYGRCRVK